MDHFLPMFPVLAFTVEYQEVLNKGKVGTKGIRPYGKQVKCQLYLVIISRLWSVDIYFCCSDISMRAFFYFWNEYRNIFIIES